MKKRSNVLLHLIKRIIKRIYYFVVCVLLRVNEHCEKHVIPLSLLFTSSAGEKLSLNTIQAMLNFVKDNPQLIKELNLDMESDVDLEEFKTILNSFPGQ